MSVIVSNGFSYIECNHPGCRTKSDQHHGENDGQRGLEEWMRKLGWHDQQNGKHICPNHRQNGGFTLPELIVLLPITIILVSLLISALSQKQNQQNTQYTDQTITITDRWHDSSGYYIGFIDTTTKKREVVGDIHGDHWVQLRLKGTYRVMIDRTGHWQYPMVDKVTEVIKEADIADDIGFAGGSRP